MKNILQAKVFESNRASEGRKSRCLGMANNSSLTATAAVFSQWGFITEKRYFLF
jgi:hypothetical protein